MPTKPAGLIVLLGLLIVVAAANVAVLRDALAVLIAVGGVAGFFGLRLVAYRLRRPEDREFDFWGGMTETMDQLLARYRRPGGNPILPPDVSTATVLPDAVPTYEGHPVGEGSSGRPPR